jgi:hypothetical protein
MGANLGKRSEQSTGYSAFATNTAYILPTEWTGKEQNIGRMWVCAQRATKTAPPFLVCQHLSVLIDFQGLSTYKEPGDPIPIDVQCVKIHLTLEQGQRELTDQTTYDCEVMTKFLSCTFYHHV